MADLLVESSCDSRAARVVAAIKRWNACVPRLDRIQKFGKMATSALVFYRGTNHLFWEDFATDSRLDEFATEKTQTWLQGDMHVYNFGSYDNDQKEVVYDLNDFDDAVIADYQFDLWRLAISIVLVARQNDDLSRKQQASIVDAAAESYLDTLSDAGQKSAAADFLTKENAYGRLDDFLKDVEEEYSRKGMLNRWAPDQGDGRQFDLGRDKLGKVTSDEREMILAAMKRYRETLSSDPATSTKYFRVKDVARRLLAGVGSLGTPRFYVLIEGGKAGKSKDDRILDIKRQTMPTACQFLDASARKLNDMFEHAGQRHAVAYNALTKHTNDHLGWMQLGDDFFSVRERSPFKEAFPGEKLDTRGSFRKLAEQWGKVLAWDHARAGRNLSSRFGEEVGRRTNRRHKEFRSLVREVAFSYADQVQSDWRSFTAALRLPQDDLNRRAFTISKLKKGRLVPR